MPYDANAPGRVPGVTESQILKEARKRYDACVSAHRDNRSRYKLAMQFVAGQQWDQQLRATRETQRRPCLVMDRLGTHVNQIVNDQRQSKPSIKVHPVDSKADIKTAEIIDGAIRSIERVSNAPSIYATAGFTQVAAGQGAWRILTDYVDEDAFEQDIFIKRILDPLSVWFDPDAKEQDASDGRFVFVEEMFTRERFEELYPDAKPSDWGPADTQAQWWSEDSVRVAEYMRIVMRPTTLYMLPAGDVMDQKAWESAGKPQAIDQRPAKRREVQWFKLGGNSVIDSRVLPGKYIPVVRVVGNEIYVDGKVQYTGLVHRAMDAQRMYNYQTSVVVEMLSLQKTAPFIGAKGQFKGVEQRWRDANITNPGYLEYEPITVNDQLAPPPQRQPAPQVPTGNVQAMQLAAADLQWITGQHAANFGAPSNETSGKAINARQREGDTATYHYSDNLAQSVRHTGCILIDYIQEIYDTPRLLRILGEDDAAKSVMHDPSQDQSLTQVTQPDGSIKKIYNLGVGRYDVAVTVGPSFGTKRQEAFQAISEAMQGNPQLWQLIGDLFFRNSDFPGSQDIADRLAKTVPPEIRGDDEQNDPQVKLAQMQAAIQKLQEMIAQREQMLQQAGQALQQMQGELQQSKAQQQAKDAQAADKSNAEAIKADAEKYRSDNEVRIAALQSQTAEQQQGNDQLAAELDQIKQLLAMLLQREELEQQQPSQDDQLLQQIVAGQQEIASAVMSLAQSSAPQMGGP